MEKRTLNKLVKQIKKNKHPSDVLDLCSHDLISTNVVPILEALLFNTQITVVAFSGNQINDEAGLALAKLISDSKSLTELDISFNKLTDKSLAQISSAIKTNQNFRSITLLGNECSAGLENEIQSLLTQRRIHNATQAKLIPTNNQMAAFSKQTSPNSSASSNDIFSLSCSPTEKSSMLETPPDFKNFLLNRKSSAPSMAANLSLGVESSLVEDGGDDKFNETLNGLVRYYTELKELKSNVSTKKQHTETECSNLQARVTELRAQLQQLENEANNERAAIKKWRTIKQTEMKKFYPIDICNIVYGEQLAERGAATMWSSRVDGWKCAVKKIDLSQCSVAEEQNYRREISVLEKLPFHPNVNKYLFHLDLGNKQLALFTTFYDTTLRSILHNSSALPPSVICKYALDIIEGIEFLHSQDILHRDLKTENIFAAVSFSREKKNDFKTITLVVADFDSTHRLKGVNECKVPIVSMAPEVIAVPSDTQSYSHHADIYAYGMVLYELVSLEVPRESAVGAVVKPDLSSHKEKYEEFVWLYEQCTASEPTKRPNASQLKRWLRRHLKSDCSNPIYEFMDASEFSPPASFSQSQQLKRPHVEVELREAEEHPENAIELFNMLTQISSGTKTRAEEPPEEDIDEEQLIPFVDSSDPSNRPRPPSKNTKLASIMKFKPSGSSLTNLCAPVIGHGSKFNSSLLLQAVKSGDVSLTRSQLSLLHQKHGGKKGAEFRESVFATPIDPLTRLTMLHHSVLRENFAVAKLLLDAGASPLATTINGDVPFHFFAIHNIFDPRHQNAGIEVNISALGSALSDGFRLIDRVNISGETALHFAISPPRSLEIESCTIASIQFLIDHGADVNMISKKGTDPLDLAIQKDNRELIVLLLNHGAEVRKKHFRQASQAANSALLQLLADSIRS